MKALVSVVAGGPETLRLAELPEPQPGPGEIRIAVACCAINYPDTLVIVDRYQFKPERPFAPGAEVCGIVDALGPGVDAFAIGQRVVGGAIFGGLAEKMVLADWRCFHVPDSMPDAIAASLLMTYGTSHHALKDRARIKAGETVLVLGAAGGVGLAAVQLAKRMGARVIAAASSGAKVEVAIASGADAGLVYPMKLSRRDAARAFSEDIRSAAGSGVDIVYDPVGGPYTEPALRALNWDGRLLIVGFPAGISSIPLNLPLLKGASIVGVFWGGFIERFPESNRRNVEELFAWYEEGALRPAVSARFPLHRGGEAISLLAERKVSGKVVVDVSIPRRANP